MGPSVPSRGSYITTVHPRLSAVEKIYNPVYDIWIKQELVEFAAKYMAGHQVKTLEKSKVNTLTYSAHLSNRVTTLTDK